MNIGVELLGRYTLKKLLGTGGMAEVFLAHDREQNRDCALKFLQSTQLGSVQGKARFLKEFQILSRLNHPTIVSVYDLHTTEEGVPFFSMQLLTGETLSKLCGVTEVDRALTLLQEIANGLHYLHSERVLYCDLKPDNIVVQDQGIKLLDFGIAQELPGGPGKAMTGTSYYMSPEQIRGDPLDQRSDIYSFGILAFELLTGKLPYADQALFNVTASHLIGKVPSPRELNRKVTKVLDRVVMLCMEKNRDDRYETIKEVIERLAVSGAERSFVSKLLGSFR